MRLTLTIAALSALLLIFGCEAVDYYGGRNMDYHAG